MMCPKCHGEMRHYERSGVTVDQCTECRGIFLDRGELERLIDAEQAWYGANQPNAPAQPQPAQPQPAQPQPMQPPPPPPPQAAPPPAQPYYRYDSDHYPAYGHPGHGYGKRKKRRSFLDELFD